MTINLAKLVNVLTDFLLIIVILWIIGKYTIKRFNESFDPILSEIDNVAEAEQAAIIQNALKKAADIANKSMQRKALIAQELEQRAAIESELEVKKNILKQNILEANKYFSDPSFQTQYIQNIKKLISLVGDCEKVNSNKINEQCLGADGLQVIKILNKDDSHARIIRLLIDSYKINQLDETLIRQALTKYFVAVLATQKK